MRPAAYGRCARRSAGDGRASASSLGLARRTRPPDLVGGGVALEHQPLAAAQHVLPELAMRPLWVVEQEDVVVPGLQIAGAVRRPRLRGVAAIAELRVVA